jgi:transcriptional regulator with XRE-family HTH domain
MNKFYDPALLKRLRTGLKISQHKLAKLSGVSRAVIANVETEVSRLSTEDAKKLWLALAEVEAESRKGTLADLRSAEPADSFVKQPGECAVMALDANARQLQMYKSLLVDVHREMDMLKRKEKEIEAWIDEALDDQLRIKALIPGSFAKKYQ